MDIYFAICAIGVELPRIMILQRIATMKYCCVFDNMICCGNTLRNDCMK
jgi:hypothetical protein